MLAIVDYGVGNLFSLKSSFAAIGQEAAVVTDPAALKKADRIILPGVGAFADAANKLAASGMRETLMEMAAAGTPLLGICLGMQLLFDKSYEYGEHAGLGLIPGEVRPIADVIPKGLKIPQIGWNALRFPYGKHAIFRYVKEGDHVYFVHSYYAVTSPAYLAADTEYGAYLTAAAAKANVTGCQFHPEKSGEVGLGILRAFCEWRLDEETVC